MFIVDRLERILTMVYGVQSYWAYYGLYPSSCMWKTKDHNVSETASVSVLRWMGQNKPSKLGPLERGSLNHWTNVQCVLDFNVKVKDNYNAELVDFIKDTFKLDILSDLSEGTTRSNSCIDMVVVRNVDKLS
jgi:hypothetical protein